MLKPGQLIQQEFLVERELRSGGMGAVYVVRQQSTGVQRALKVMHPGIVQHQKARERFEREARVGGIIPSDHIVQVISAGVDEQTSLPYLVMELLQGETLGDVVRRQGVIDLATFRLIFEHLCHAVGAAHELSIVHRDLKPENLFLARTRAVGVPFVLKVLDFGIAKILADSGTHRTQGMGTPLWLSPEQTGREARVGPTADVWALGLIAFYSLTGHLYWRSGEQEELSVQQILREMLLDDLPPAEERASELGVRLPAGFGDWFGRCVRREPGERFADARVAQAELQRALSAPSAVDALGGAEFAAAPTRRVPGQPSAGTREASVPRPFSPWVGRTGTAPQTPSEPTPGDPLPLPPTDAPVSIPGTFGGQQREQRSTGRTLGLIAMGSVVVIAVSSAAVLLSRALTPGPAPASPNPVPVHPDPVPAVDPASRLLEEAQLLADQGALVLAHSKLTEIPAHHSLRQSEAFKSIERRWADNMLQAAQKSPDPRERRNLLDNVAKAPEVDAERRERAAAELAKLDKSERSDVQEERPVSPRPDRSKQADSKPPRAQPNEQTQPPPVTDGSGSLGDGRRACDSPPSPAQAEACQKACDGGRFPECAQLGFQFLTGSGVERDSQRAQQLFRKACDGNNARGCNGLGAMYQWGTGVPLDLQRAIELYGKACDLGDQEACRQVAVQRSTSTTPSPPRKHGKIIIR